MDMEDQTINPLMMCVNNPSLYGQYKLGLFTHLPGDSFL